MAEFNRVRFTSGMFKDMTGTVVGFTYNEPHVIIQLDVTGEEIWVRIPQLESE